MHLNSPLFFLFLKCLPLTTLTWFEILPSCSQPSDLGIHPKELGAMSQNVARRDAETKPVWIWSLRRWDITGDPIDTTLSSMMEERLDRNITKLNAR